MSDRAGSILRSSAASAIATLLSRLLGLLRVMLEARVLGGGALAAAWQFAFQIPNLFRRLLGEGALAAALVPLFTECEEKNGTEAARIELGKVFVVLSSLLAILTVGASLLVMGLDALIDFKPYVKTALKLIPLLIPYAIFMCLVGVGGALLNTQKVFFLVSAGALIFNIFMVGFLTLCRFWWMPEPALLYREMSWIVLSAGMLNLLLIAFLMKRKGIFPVFRRFSFRQSPFLLNLWHKVLPGFIGYSALQLSVVVDSTLGLWVGPMAVPALNNSARIIDLPIGVYALSIGAVLLAQMSRSSARGKNEEIVQDLLFSLRNVFFVCMPIAAFVMGFGTTLIRLLFEGGRFTEMNVIATQQALFFYAMGIPFFCSVKVLTPAFHSRQKMLEPMFASITAIAVNIVLSTLLMFPLKQGGIALATVISSFINNALLLVLLRRSGLQFPSKLILRSLLLCGASAAAAALLTRYGLSLSCLPHPARPIWQFLLQGSVFGVLYLGFSLLHPAELRSCLGILKRRVKRQ